MKKRPYKKSAFWFICSVFVLFVGFVLCRYAFFGVHGLKEWPLNLAVIGLIAIVIAGFCKANKVMMYTAGGYLLGFFIGLIFNEDGLDSGGGRTNNFWIIWTAAFLAAILGSVILELAGKRIWKDRRRA